MSKEMKRVTDLAVISTELIGDIRTLIEETRSAVAVTVNAGVTMLYWRIGKRVNEEILKGKRADYGAEIVSTVSRQLETDYGRGFGEKNLRRMIQFAEAFPDEKIIVSLIRQLSWLDKYDRKENEASPLGIILCAEKNTEQIELLELGRSGIHVAEYLTELPPKDVLKRKLHEAIARSKLFFENHGEDLDAEVTE